MTDTTASSVAAAIDHAADPTKIYCRDCAFEHVDDLTADTLERVPEENVGTVLLCDGCETNIANTLPTDE